MKIDKSWYVRPKDNSIPEHVAAGGVVFRTGGDKVFVALLKDHEYRRYVLPKGGVEKDEELEDAAVREIKEESGLDSLEYVSKIGIKERLDYEKTEWKTTHYFLYRTKQVFGVQKLDIGEDYTLEWFDINRLPDMFWPEQLEILSEARNIVINLLQR